MSLQMVADSLDAYRQSREVEPERCDRCNAKECLMATKGSLKLLFCRHHGNKHMADLLAQGFMVSEA